ncbi:MAG: hypothetical protein KatS3mg115_0534 [Candidatus Poribacteria bacterium]|nr:MAG: hypothetical protein KatS3mg115_0534 [Candidatus Poribacteria bacterium]
MPHVVFLIGEAEYRSERTMPQVAWELVERYGWSVSLLQAKDRQNLPGLEALQEADCLVTYLRFRELPPEQLEPIRAYLDSGRPVVGLRTSTHAFRYPEGSPLAIWNHFGAEVFGTPWRFHYGHESSTVVYLHPEAEGDPILNGVDYPFVARSWLYYVLPLPADCRPLLMGRSVGPSPREERVPNPVAWVRTTPRRTFYTSLGHPEDFALPQFRQLLRNGIRWALGESLPPTGA